MGRSLIVEADGGSRGNPGVAGYGAVVFDAASGAVLAERAEPLGKASNNVAEYTGLIEGLQAVVDHAPGSDVAVRMDSKLVIEQMSGRWKIKHEDMKRLAAGARELVKQLKDDGGSVTFEWIPREKNKAADKLSNDGMDGVTVVRDVWVDDEADSGSSAQSEDDEPTGEGSGSDRQGAGDSTGSTPAEPDADVDLAGTQGASGDEQPAQEAEDATRAKREARKGPTRVVLVRHGVTEFTVGGRLDGRDGADPSLNEQGRAQAGAAAQAVRALVGSDAVVISSSLKRAQETAAPIAAALGTQVVVNADWDEQCFGDWDGLTFKEIAEQAPNALREMQRDPSFLVPGGESRADLDARVKAAFKDAVDGGGTAVVVTHRLPIMAVLAELLGLDVAGAWKLAAAPASLTGVEVWDGGRSQVAFTNDTHHLR